MSSDPAKHGTIPGNTELTLASADLNFFFLSDLTKL